MIPSRQTVPLEVIFVPVGTPQSGPTVRPRPATTTTEGSSRLGLVLAVVATAQLMVSLDLTIVNVALPHIQTALRFSGTNQIGRASCRERV